MKKLLAFLFFLLAPLAAQGQTTTTMYRVDTIAALKAIPTSRPPVVIVMDVATGGQFEWGTTPCSAADDVFQVTPTSGPTGCWTRMSNANAVGKSATNNGVLVTSGTGVPSISTTLPAITAGAGLVTATGSTTARSLATRFADIANVLDYGAVCDSTTGSNGTDNTTAFGLAAATGKPVYIPASACAFGSMYRVTDITTFAPGQAVYGDGQTRTTIAVPATFNLAALGVFRVREPSGASELDYGGYVHNLGFFFVQPDSNVRGNMVVYPPAIYASNASRSVISNIRCVAAMRCLEMRGNTGGSMVSFIEASVFDFGVAFDGALDTVYMDNIILTSTGLTALQTEIMFDATTYGIYLGRVDGLIASNIAGVSMRRLIYATDNGGQVTNGTISNVVADDSGIVVRNGSALTINGLSGSVVRAATEFVKVETGGRLVINGASMRVLIAPTNPVFQLSASAAVTLLQINGLDAQMSTFDKQLVYASGGATSMLGLDNVKFTHAVSTVYTNPVVEVADAQVTISGLSSTNPIGGGGSGDVLKITTSQGTSISGLQLNGWTTNLPAGQVVQQFPGKVEATAYNGNTFTTGTGTLTLGASKTFTASNTLTLTATDGSTLAIGAGGTLGSNAYTSTAYAPLASPTFTGTVTIPTPHTIGAVSMTATGTQLNYLNAATGTTGTASTNVVFSTSPTIVTPTITTSATVNGTTATGMQQLFRSSDTTWFGRSGQVVNSGNIGAFFSTASAWSVTGSTFSATKDGGGTFAPATTLWVASQENSVTGSFFRVVSKAAGATTTDGAVTTLFSVLNGNATASGTISATIASTSQTNVACYNSTSGLFTYQTWATGCLASSARFKENVTVKSNADALKVVASLEPVKFQYKASAGIDREWHNGFIAEQVVKVAPDLVEFDADGKTPRAVKYQEMAPYFAGAIKELKAANDNLKSEIAELKKKVK